MSLGWAILCGEGRDPSAAFGRAQWLSWEEFPDSERCFWYQRWPFLEKGRFSVLLFWKTGPAEAGREGRKGGRVTSDGFGSLHSCGTSLSDRAQPP